MTSKEYLLGCIEDSVIDIFEYDRKYDSALCCSQVDMLVKNHLITKEECLEAFSKGLEEIFKE